MVTFFSISCTVFTLQEPEVRTLKQSLETSCGSRKVSTNRCSKTPTIDILKCYWGYTLVDWNPWLHF